MKDTNTDNARKVTINIVKANIFAIVLMVASAVVLIVPYCLIWGGKWKTGGVERFFDSFFSNGVVFLVAMLVGVVVHELIHGITWACFAPSGWKSISFGVIWKRLTPYCLQRADASAPLYHRCADAADCIGHHPCNYLSDKR